MINESKLNVRMLHLMESGFFGKQLLNEGALNINDSMKVRIFQTFYNYWGNTDNWILVDGIAGEQTANAINLLKKDNFWKEAFDKSLKDGLNYYCKYILEQIKSSFLSDLKELNNIHNLRMLQAILCLAGYTEVKPDGVMGTITKDAMKAKLDTDDITKVTDEKFKAVIDAAIANVQATNMAFEIEGVDAGTGAEENAGKEAVAANPDGQSEEDKKWFEAADLPNSAYITLNSDYEYNAAIAWKNPDGTYSSYGYFKLGPNAQTSLFFPPKDYTKGEIYIYAYSGEYKTNGSLELCYNPNKDFAFKNAQSECNSKAKFRKINYSGLTIYGHKAEKPAESVPPKPKASSEDLFKNWIFNKPSSAKQDPGY